MGSEKREQLRGIGRWGVWVCTFLVISMIGVSIFYYTNIALIVSKPMPAARRVVMALYFQHGRLGFEYGSATSTEFGLEALWVDETRLSGSMERVAFELTQDPPKAWWTLPYRESTRKARGAFYFLEIPLLYPAVMLGVWSWWLIRGVKRRRLAGCCEGCGYLLEGLDGGVCPECGAGSVCE